MNTLAENSVYAAFVAAELKHVVSAFFNNGNFVGYMSFVQRSQCSTKWVIDYESNN
ncbi:hypothetical protein ACKOUJ_06580 [Legionella pneumophila]|uniref:hypothetical protein n=1 Tax=Legionella pneumophila TaxID=446 RepID=UPI000A8F497A|nr:hypothetical protein [Legionella pneumophila]HAT3856309.1 hypothetical protein [Legionella pneumophila]HAT3859130.1 hypothetical protein [Legionella pneumophila]HAT3861265.1 hypothetical protein [Legionella pneumophila]HAT3862359.1 hypothetical protein [Legionella pneumophila]HAT3866005.1 hypothetical protein [Legionella pneumophila]